MTHPNIENLIVKFLDKSATAAELNELADLLQDSQYETIFNELVRTHYAINHQMNTTNANEIAAPLLDKIRTEAKSSKVFNLYSVLKYAAILIVALGIFGIFKFQNTPELIIADEVVTLKLGNSEVQELDVNSTKAITDEIGNIIGTQNGNKLSHSKTETSKELVYNVISVPNGKTFQLELSDGTMVSLNAGTSLRYPANFMDEGNREVYLNGEAYFDVAHNSKQPFVVNAEDINVRVLGTQFNISTYPEDESISTVLVQGKVGVYKSEDLFDENTATLLKPGYAAHWNKLDKNITTEQVNTQIHTAWVDGKLIFKHLPFYNIIKKLERHYNVNIINKNNSLGGEFFTASFDIESIEEVMTAFQINYDINFHIENNQIIID